MNILVVGGTRFFGIPMVEKLLSDGHAVTIATRGNTKNVFGEKVNYITLNRSNYDSVQNALQGKTYDVVIDKIAYCSNDVKNLLENVSCKKYIQMSSCSVYFEDKENIKEEDFEPANYPLRWMNRSEDYSEGKRQAERAALEYMDISQCIFVRYPVVLGPNDYTGRLKFYGEHIMENRAMNVDDFEYVIPFIHEDEAGRFMAHLVDKNISGAVNGSAVGTVSAGEIIAYIESTTGKKALLSSKADDAPYNGTTSNLSYDLSKAYSTGFVFSNLKDWLFELINSNLSI